MILKYSLVHHVMVLLMIMIFLCCKMFFHWRCTWIKCYFFHSTKLKWSCKINKKTKLLSNQVFLNNNKIVGVHLHKGKIMIQLHVCDFIHYFILKTQITSIWSLKNIKMSETLCVIAFDIICSFSFALNFVHCTMHLPFSSNWTWLEKLIYLVYSMWLNCRSFFV
jgi:hypothetical protein